MHPIVHDKPKGDHILRPSISMVSSQGTDDLSLILNLFDVSDAVHLLAKAIHSALHTLPQRKLTRLLTYSLVHTSPNPMNTAKV